MTILRLSPVFEFSHDTIPISNCLDMLPSCKPDLVGHVIRISAENHRFQIKQFHSQRARTRFPRFHCDAPDSSAVRLSAIGIASTMSRPTNGTWTIRIELSRVSNAYASPPPLEPKRSKPGAYSATSYSLLNATISSTRHSIRYSLPINPSPPLCLLISSK